jgi:hypothetical protein
LCTRQCAERRCDERFSPSIVPRQQHPCVERYRSRKTALIVCHPHASRRAAESECYKGTETSIPNQGSTPPPKISHLDPHSHATDHIRQHARKPTHRPRGRPREFPHRSIHPRPTDERRRYDVSQTEPDCTDDGTPIGHTPCTSQPYFIHDDKTQETINGDTARRLPASEPCPSVTATSCCSAFHDYHSTVIRDDTTGTDQQDRQRVQ